MKTKKYIYYYVTNFKCGNVRIIESLKYHGEDNYYVMSR
jgi:hypothetical protein